MDGCIGRSISPMVPSSMSFVANSTRTEQFLEPRRGLKSQHRSTTPMRRPRLTSARGWLGMSAAR